MQLEKGQDKSHRFRHEPPADRVPNLFHKHITLVCALQFTLCNLEGEDLLADPAYRPDK